MNWYRKLEIAHDELEQRVIVNSRLVFFRRRNELDILFFFIESQETIRADEVVSQ